MNFFAELKRRNVYKVAIAYIVTGWALSQGIAQVFPVFDIPNWLGFGDKKRAIDELDRGYSDGETNYLFVIKVGPLLDDLRAVIRVSKRSCRRSSAKSSEDRHLMRLQAE